MNIDGLTLFGHCFSAPYNVPIQIWRHAVISGLHLTHFCYLSALYFDCWCIFWMKICFLWRYLSYHHDTSHHDTCLSAAMQSLFVLGISAACHSIFAKMTYMICDPCTCYCWNWCVFEGLWHAGLKDQVQLTKWGDLVTFSSAYVFKNA